MKRENLHNVEFLRFVFSITIVYFHILHSNIMGCVGEDPRYLALQSLSGNAGLIVECFFILSGYFLFASVRDHGDMPFLAFAARKAFRLGPVLAFSTVIGVLFFRQSKYAAVFNVLFLQCTGLSLEYKGINWYISPLFWGLLFYFALLKYFDRKKAHVGMAVLVYFCYLVNITRCSGGFGRETVYGVVNLGLARALAGLGLGYLLGLALNEADQLRLSAAPGWEKRLSVGACAVSTLLEAGILGFLLKYFLLGGKYQNRMIVVVLFSVLLICFVCRKGLISRLLNAPLCSALGRYAYSIYVMQQTAFFLLQRTLWKTGLVDRVGLCIGLSLLFSAALGVGTYYLVERPGMKLYSRLSALIVKKDGKSL